MAGCECCDAAAAVPPIGLPVCSRSVRLSSDTIRPHPSTTRLAAAHPILPPKSSPFMHVRPNGLSAYRSARTVWWGHFFSQLPQNYGCPFFIRFCTALCPPRMYGPSGDLGGSRHGQVRVGWEPLSPHEKERTMIELRSRGLCLHGSTHPLSNHWIAEVRLPTFNSLHCPPLK